MSQPASYNDVFISYSRRDIKFTKKFVKALYNDIENIWVDWEDIEVGDDWWDRICRGIDSSSNFVFVITPDSIKSEYCRKEIDHAVEMGKRIVPLLHIEATDPEEHNQMHPAIQRHQWLPFREQDNFEETIARFLETIRTDPGHVETHTQLLTKARDWENNDRDASRLLSGRLLEEAEIWQAQASGKSPHVTNLQADFIYVSRLHEQNYSRRIFAGGAILVVVSLIAMIVAIGFYFDARANARRAAANALEAEENARIAEENARIAEENGEEAIGLASIVYAGVAEEEGDFHMIYPLLLQANELAGGNPLVLNFFTQTNSNLFLTGGFDTIPDIEGIPAENLTFNRAILSPDGSQLVTVYDEYVSGRGEDPRFWNEYVKNTIVSVWDSATGELLNEIIIPAPEVAINTPGYDSYSAVDVNFDQGIILIFRDVIQTDDNERFKYTYLISAWSIQLGTRLAQISYVADENQLDDGQFYTYPRTYPGAFATANIPWGLSLQSIQETVRGETRTVATSLRLGNLVELTLDGGWNYPGEVSARVNSEYLFLIEHNTYRMIVIDPLTQEQVLEIDLRSRVDDGMRRILSLNLMVDDSVIDSEIVTALDSEVADTMMTNEVYTRVVVVYENSARQQNALIFDVSDDISLNTYQNTRDWTDDVVAGDTLSNYIFLRNLNAQFFVTQRDREVDNNVVRELTLNVWNLDRSQVIFTETLLPGEDIRSLEYDESSGLLAVIIRSTQESGDSFELRIYDFENDRDERRPLNNIPSGMGFSDGHLWLLDGQTLLELTPDTSNRCASDDICETVRELFDIPAGLSVIDYDSGEQSLILHNRNKGFFYIINLNRESELTVIESSSFDFRNFMTVDGAGTISDNRYVTLKFDERRGVYTYVTFTLDLSTNPPTLTSNSYFDDLPENQAGSVLAVTGDGDRILGLSSIDTTLDSPVVELLDIQLADRPVIPLENLVARYSVLDPTESTLAVLAVDAGNFLTPLTYRTFLIDLGDSAYETTELASFTAPDGPIAVHFSADGNHFGYVASVQEETSQSDEDSGEDVIATRFWIWDTATQELIYNPRLVADVVNFVFAPDQSIYVLLSNGDLLKINYETEIQTSAGSFGLPQSGFDVMAISPDGTKIVVVDGSRFSLWDAAAGRSIQLSLFEETDTILNAVFIDDNRILFELGSRMVIWDVVTASEISALVCENRLVLPVSEEDRESYELDLDLTEVCPSG